LGIDTNTDEIKKVIRLQDVEGAIGLEPRQLTYINATGLVYSPQENFLYIAHLDRSFVSIYDLNNSRFLSQIIPLKGYFPNYMFTNDDHSKIYSLNIRSDNVSVIDTHSKTVEKVIDLHTYVSTAVEGIGKVPKEFSLGQNYPNPFNPSTTIRYDIPKVATVSLRIFNVLGQLVATLVEEKEEAGHYQARWNANAPSGIYFYRLQAGGSVETKKMILLH
jgi:YVTN family beta-propeller protein